LGPKRRHFAHSTSRPDRADWQPLDEHLLRVATFARERAAKFGMHNEATTERIHRMSNYAIQIEVAGPLAMFTRPDTGGTPTSYPVPTWSACKGIFEAIAFLADGAAWMCPTKVEVCRRRGIPGGSIRFQKYTTNYGGPLRKRSVISKGANMQLFATALTDVCYRLYGEVRGRSSHDGRNPRHHLQELFQRRLNYGQCHHTPALGWREFTCSYWGPFRENYEVDTELDLTIPSMLVSVWDRANAGGYGPRFTQDIRVRRGVLRFAE
jgi:CRISPR-associated protein Cas5d